MTEDVRNSVYLWGATIAIFALLWAGLHFHALDWIPDWALWPMVGIAAVGNLAQFVWGIWTRRASSSDVSNQR